MTFKKLKRIAQSQFEMVFTCKPIGVSLKVKKNPSVFFHKLIFYRYGWRVVVHKCVDRWSVTLSSECSEVLYEVF